MRDNVIWKIAFCSSSFTLNVPLKIIQTCMLMSNIRYESNSKKEKKLLCSLSLRENFPLIAIQTCKLISNTVFYIMILMCESERKKRERCFSILHNYSLSMWQSVTLHNKSKFQISNGNYSIEKLQKYKTSSFSCMF